MAIKIFFADISISLLQRKKLKLFIEALVGKEKKQLFSLSIIFCTDEYLLDINKQFLKHDFYTDIITFNLAKKADIIEGEIYISVHRIKENAKSNGVSQNEELHRVIFHGVLHLCGYYDKSSADKKMMTFLENACLKNYFS